jgi:TetR/AcrR family transcriptional regulator
METVAPTRVRILDAAVDLFGGRGVEATSLDEIAARVGVRKQTVLYWFPSKDELLDGVILQVASELSAAMEAAVRAAGEDPMDRITAVVRAAFRPAVRRPALLGLLREVSRLSPRHAALLRDLVQPLVARATAALAAEMQRGRLRAGDPGLMVALIYTTVTGMATEPVALTAVGWRPDATGLRRLRSELLAFLEAALRP